MEKINIEDLNWGDCSVNVNGKGSKQREVGLFHDRVKVWLKKYLASRKDNCKTLYLRHARA
ncbi:hypothetical protein [Paenibacillus sp. B-A-8]|uniref:hypothetical protein n=1 Tax=Paenibacillus sp. B-A-8 TaxID=3400419 RepID=UPI003B02B8AB